MVKITINAITRYMGILLTICCQYNANALAPNQQLFTHLNRPDGLPHNTVKAIFQDQSGFMWFGTANGLSRYDGYGFVNYDLSHNDHVASPVITDITEDNKGNLWLSTYSGLYKFNPGDKTFHVYYCDNTNKYSASNKINALLSIDNEIWIATYQGLFIFDTNTELMRKINKPKLRNLSKINAITKTKNGAIWLGLAYGKGFLYHQPSTNSWQQFYLSHQEDNDLNTINAIVGDGDTLYLSTANGLVKYHLKTQKTSKITFASDNSNVIIDSLLKHEHILWIGTKKNSLYRYDLLKHSAVNYPFSSHNAYGISNNPINTLYMGKDEMLWLGTQFYGTSYTDLHQSYIIHRKLPVDSNSLSSSIVNSIHEDNERLWFATSSGISAYDKKQHTYSNYELGQSNSVYTSSYGTVWVGKDEGLFKLDSEDNIFVEIESIPQNEITDIYQPIENALILATTKGLYYWNIKHNTYRQIKSLNHSQFEPDNKYITALLPLSGNRLCVASTDGLFVVNLAEYYALYPLNEGLLKSELENTEISHMAKGQGENSWIATTDKGIFQVNRHFHILNHFTHKDGLPLDAVRSLTMMDNVVWVGTDAGLVTIAQAEQHWRIELIQNKPLNHQYLPASVYKSTNHTLIYGSNEGAVEFSPRLLAFNKSAIRVTITDFKLLNKAQSTDRQATINNFHSQYFSKAEPIVLSYKQNQFSVGFSALNYRNPNHYYRYKLTENQAVKKDWIMADFNDRELIFTSLPAGNYTLSLQASESLVTWDKHETKLEIVILPPWWRSQPAYFVYSALLLTVILLLVQYRTFRLKILTRKLEIKVNERTREVQQQAQVISDKNAQIEELLDKKNEMFENISHELRTPLTLIQAPVSQVLHAINNASERHLLTLADRNIKRLCYLVDQLLYMSSLTGFATETKRHYSLSSIAKAISASFQSLSVTQKIEFDFQIEDDILIHAVANSLDTILINLLFNGFKYTKPGGRVELSVRHMNKTANIVIKDNGIGMHEKNLLNIFKRFTRDESGQHNLIQGMGVGLAIVKQLIELHDGEIVVSSQLGIGSQFTVTLPTVEVRSDDLVEQQQLAADSLHQLNYLQAQFDNQDQQCTTVEKSFVEKPTINESTERNTLLIIEDTHDMREYLGNLLLDSYQCILAVNGEQGIKAARKHLPDVIICDVMMPGMDGFEVLDKLREDMNTSHIPVLMLTAKGDRDSRLLGLSKLADDYITKPFDAEELLARLQATVILRQLQQQQMQRLISNQDSVNKNVNDNSDVPVHPGEQEFVIRINGVIAKSYSNSNFNVEQLAEQASVCERTLLYKMRAVLGKSPSEYIREYRLNKAKELLINKGRVNIKNLIDRVGFTNTSYFHRCFKAYVGCTPKEYVSLHKTGCTNPKK